jgi:hypothetical protein
MYAFVRILFSSGIHQHVERMYNQLKIHYYSLSVFLQDADIKNLVIERLIIFKGDAMTDKLRLNQKQKDARVI